MAPPLPCRELYIDQRHECKRTLEKNRPRHPGGGGTGQPGQPMPLAGTGGMQAACQNSAWPRASTAPRDRNPAQFQELRCVWMPVAPLKIPAQPAQAERFAQVNALVLGRSGGGRNEWHCRTEMSVEIGLGLSKRVFSCRQRERERPLESAAVFVGLLMCFWLVRDPPSARSWPPSASRA